MRKLFLTSFKPKGEDWNQRLVVLNIDGNDSLPEEDQYAMAVKKVETWFTHLFPTKELSGVIVHPTIGDGIQPDFLTQTKPDNKTIKEKVITVISQNWDSLMLMPTPFTFDLISVLNKNGFEIVEKSSGPPTITYYTSSDIPRKDGKEEDLSDYVLIDTSGERNPDDYEIGYFNFSSNEWCLKHLTDKVDKEAMRWTYLTSFTE